MNDPREEQTESWLQNAERWTAAVRGGTIASRREATDAAILAAARSGPLGRVLDVGCGEGWLCRELQGEATRLVGVDASQALIARAEPAGGASYHCLSYAEICAEPERLGGPFDTMLCNFALLDDQLEPLLDALAAVAAAKARLLIQTLHPLALAPPYEDGWRIERFEAFTDEGWTPMPFFARTLASWVAALSKRWALESLQEPRLPSAPLPSSLLMRATRR